MTPASSITVPQDRASSLQRSEQLSSWLRDHFDWPKQQLGYGAQVFDLLAQLGIDQPGQICGFIQTGLPLKEKQKKTIRSQFGANVVQMLESIERLQKLSKLSQQMEPNNQAEFSDDNLRKLLITMVDDVRVVVIKLADQLCRLRTVKTAAIEVREQLGRMTLDVYAPLANRLGIWQLKWELEDLAFKYLQPDDYHSLARRLDDTRRGREAYISRLTEQIYTLLKQPAIESAVYGRPKHIYSIWNKMKTRGMSFRSLSDLRAVRILVNNIADCYAALGVVHTQWRHIPGEFDDYIATPKKNGYRSIHTVVIGPEDKRVEVQIRTHEMHQENELGVAAHWRYKENKRQDDSIDNKILWLRQLLEWKDEMFSAGELIDQYRQDVAADTVYVFTPKGNVIGLPTGSTPIDFAYAVHSEVGHRTRGARVNDKMVPLATVLQTGDQVEVQTVKTGQPSRDWIRPDLGYTKTHRARSRIQHWFKQANRDQQIAAGRQMLEKELRRMGLEAVGYDKIAQRSNFKHSDDLLVALANGEHKLARAIAPFKDKVAPPSENIEYKKRHSKRALGDRGLRVQGVGNLMTHMAKCCGPVPGDEIVGYVTQGQGIAIHRRSCKNVENLSEERQSRLLDVGWGADDDGIWPIDVKVSAYFRGNLYNDITQCIESAKVELLGMHTSVDDDFVAHIDLKLGVSGLQNLSSLFNQIEKIRNVIEVSRQIN